MVDRAIRIVVDSTGAQRGAREVEGSLRKISRSARGSVNDVESLGASFERVRRRIFSLQSAFAALGVSISLGAAVREFASFERGLIGVGKTTNIEGLALEKLGVGVQEIARRVPIATNELLSLAEAAGQMGVEGSANILAFTETLGRLQLSTDLVGEEAARTVATLLKLTDTPTSEVANFGSALVALGNSAAATEGQIAAVATRVAQSTQQFEIGAANVLAISTSLKALGVEAERGGTATGKAFRAINNAIQDGGKDLLALQSIVGQTREQLAVAFDADPTAVFQSFIEGLNRVGPAGAVARMALDELGLSGDRVGPALITLAKNIDEMSKNFAIAREEIESSEALMTESEKAAKGLGAQMTLVGNILSEAGVIIGRELAPALIQAATAFGDFIKQAADAGSIKAAAETIGAAFQVVVNNMDLVLLGAIALVARGFGPLILTTGAVQTGLLNVAAAAIKTQLAAVQSARAHVALTAANLKEAQAAVTNATAQRVLTGNYAVLRTALIAQTAAQRAHTAALAASTIAARAATLAMATLRGALAFFGGPIGLAITALAAGFLLLRDNVDEAGMAAEEAVRQSKNLADELKRAVSSAEELNNQRLIGFEQELLRLRVKVSELRVEFTDARQAVDNLFASPDDLGPALDRTTAEAIEAQEAFNKANAELKEFGDNLEKLRNQSGIIGPELPPIPNQKPSAPIAGPPNLGGVGGATGSAIRAQEEFTRSLARLRDELDPVGAEFRAYRENFDLLTEAQKRGKLTLAEYTELLGALNLRFAEGGEVAQEAAENARRAQEALDAATSGLVDSIATLNTIEGFGPITASADFSELEEAIERATQRRQAESQAMQAFGSLQSEEAQAFLELVASRNEYQRIAEKNLEARAAEADALGTLEDLERENQLLRDGADIIDLQTAALEDQLSAAGVAASRIEELTMEFEALARQRETLADIRDGLDDVARAGAGAFTSFITGAENARDAALGLLETVRDIVLDVFVTQPLEDFLRGQLGGLAGFFSPSSPPPPTTAPPPPVPGRKPPVPGAQPASVALQAAQTQEIAARLQEQNVMVFGDAIKDFERCCELIREAAENKGCCEEIERAIDRDSVINVDVPPLQGADDFNQGSQALLPAATQLSATMPLFESGAIALFDSATALQSAAQTQQITSILDIIATSENARGGVVVGPGTGTSDSIVARVSNGEFIVNAEATQANLAFLRVLNDSRDLGEAIRQAMPDQDVLRLAEGGGVPGLAARGTDTIPALLTPGEFVVNAEAAQDNMTFLRVFNESQDIGEAIQKTMPAGEASLRFSPGGEVPLNMGVPGRDSVPALLTPGEVVVNAPAAQDNIEFLRAFNDSRNIGEAMRRAMPGQGVLQFNEGGEVRVSGSSDFSDFEQPKVVRPEFFNQNIQSGGMSDRDSANLARMTKNTDSQARLARLQRQMIVDDRMKGKRSGFGPGGLTQQQFAQRLSGRRSF